MLTLGELIDRDGGADGLEDDLVRLAVDAVEIAGDLNELKFYGNAAATLLTALEPLDQAGVSRDLARRGTELLAELRANPDLYTEVYVANLLRRLSEDGSILPRRRD